MQVGDTEQVVQQQQAAATAASSAAVGTEDTVYLTGLRCVSVQGGKWGDADKKVLNNSAMDTVQTPFRPMTVITVTGPESPARGSQDAINLRV